MEYDLKIYADNIEPVALNQIYTLLAQPTFLGEKVRIMPDVHAGLGCVVGFTSTMKDKVIPNIIGVDIGCGMLCVELGKVDISFPALDDFIKGHIPSGSEVRREVLGTDLINALYCKKSLRNMDRLEGSLGTLGGGNHFIEVDVDDKGNYYLVIHTGSRNLGLQVANIYQKMAVESCKKVAESERVALIEKLKKENRHHEIPDELKKLTDKYAYKSKIPADLCYLDGEEMEKYMHDMRICQEFAVRNRKKIADEILAFLNIRKFSSFETVHNFIDDKGIIRKGAVPAHLGQKILIPMNMRDGCLVCIGKGNEDWNCSAPHGAGRICSRSEAKKLLSVEEFQNAMEGIYTTTANESTIDEAPQAYKPAQSIMNLISPTAEIIEVIKPVYNFKAAE